MKVGIVTIIDNDNYGNRLQNYATEKVLNKIGVDCKTIRLENENGNILKTSLKQISIIDKFKISYLKSYYTYCKKQIYRKINRKYIHANLKKRRTCFKKFSDQYIKYTNFELKQNKYDLNELSYFDYFVCGSDQIWNPYFLQTSGIYFLDFADYERSVSYAASFGIRHIPQEVRKKYLEWLSNIKYLSVREKEGAKIIKELINKKAEVLVDPTLMLNKDEWKEISKKPSIKINDKYVFCYFLGPIDSKIKKYISKFASRRRYKMVNLERENPNQYWYSTGPAEFIWLIEHCEVMFTDSFHGSVFSVLMNIPFIVFERNGTQVSMNSRIDTLLNTLQIPDRKFNNQTIEQVMNKDYTHIPAILERERNKAIKFLKDAMEIE